MEQHNFFMQRCTELAKMGAGHVSPNPMVGCVIVHNGVVIGEGFHEKHGQAHAEVNAINAVQDKELLKESTLYVSLEPCAHFGLTPPCSDLIIKTGIPRVVVGAGDPNEKVAGKGIARMKNSGIEVITGILENQCRELNKRFFTFQEKKRPFIILKWAETKDGFIDYPRTSREFGQPSWITGEKALKKVHEMRAEEDAILVGTNTALKDNPSLTVRLCEGRNPLRIVIDNRLQLPANLNLFDRKTPTLVCNSLKNHPDGNPAFIKIDFEKEIVPQILSYLHSLNILSLIVEGGRKTLESFINAGLWDEAFIFTGNIKFGDGTKAPSISGAIIRSEKIDDDKLVVYKNLYQKVTAFGPAGKI
jgi:diaminohydroxyphosphoribosylaminopyrimidine deaminase/5-amino-6-(5-phosphoribosylamino)uracil reductase